MICKWTICTNCPLVCLVMNGAPLCLFLPNADADECNALTACGPNAICANADGSYTCTCQPGFTVLDGKDAKIDGCEGELLVHMV
jgi:hypothetical protein